MFKYLKNDKGVALIFVIIMLVVVGGLSAALLVSARGHVGTAVHEESMAQAFHSAEAGVEYVRANINEALEKLADENYNNEVSIFDETDISFNNLNKLKFDVYIEDKDNYELKSVGKYNDYKKEIKFNIFSLKNTNKIFNIKANLNNNSLNSILPNNHGRNLYDTGGVNIDPNLYPSNFREWIEIKNEAIDWYEDYSQKYEKVILIKESDLIINPSGNESASFEDSIIFVDGDLDLNPKTSWENSIIVVSGEIRFSGGHNQHDIINSTFFSYGGKVQTAGPTDEWSVELDFDKLPLNPDSYLSSEIRNWHEQ